MIVISGALVFVALVLLVIGLFDPDLGFVYASIAVSGAALVFLLIGVFQRRGELAIAEPAGEVPAEGALATAAVTTVVARAEAPVADTDGTPAAEALGGTVLVVADRPRYHVAGCRYLAGKDAEAVDVTEAREEGFTPCGVCKPDVALAAAASVPALEEPVVDETVDDDDLVPDLPDLPAVPATTTRPPARGTARVAQRPTAAKAVKAPAKAATKAPAAKAPAKAAKAPAKSSTQAPTKAAPAKKAAPAAAKVVVIPDRGKFHTAECRFVRGVAGTEELTKAAASRQGYAACGVCKP